MKLETRRTIRRWLLDLPDRAYEAYVRGNAERLIGGAWD